LSRSSGIAGIRSRFRAFPGLANDVTQLSPLSLKGLKKLLKRLLKSWLRKALRKLSKGEKRQRLASRF
jgi:hypothetical protein